MVKKQEQKGDRFGHLIGRRTAEDEAEATTAAEPGTEDPRQQMKAARQQMRDAQLALGQDPVSAVSVALRASEFAELDRIAAHYNGSRGSLMTVLMRHAMREFAAGRVSLKVNPKTRKFE